MLQQLFNSADVAVVGQFSAQKELALAAVGSTSSIVNLYITIFTGLAVGANVVIAEEFETSIEVFNQVLTQYLVPRQDIDAFSARLRQQNYRMIRRMSSAADSLESVASRLPEMGVQTMRLEAGSPLCGLSLAQSNLRREHAVTVVAVARGEQDVIASPPADFVMEAGDLLYLFGKTDKLFAVKPVICAAPADPGAAGAQKVPQA